MEKLYQIVRPDWQRHQYARAAGDTHLWRLGQVLVLLVATALFFITLLDLPPLWRNVWRFVLTWAAFLNFSMWAIERGTPGAMRRTVVRTVMFAVLAAVAAYLDPRVQQGISSVLPYTAVLVALFIPAISWSTIWPVLLRHPLRARRLGLEVTGDWPADMLIGVFAGGALAMHLLYTTSLLPPEVVTRLSFSRSWLVWSFSLLAGLWVPAEEFLFRGLGFHLLYEKAQHSFWAVTVRLTLLNVLIYLVLALHNPSITLTVVTIVYRTALSLINVFLFYRRKSLVPCLLANLVFTFVMMQLFRL